MKQTICTVGDTIFHDGFPVDYDLNPIRNVLAQADVRLFNLEIVVSDGAPFGSTYCGGTHQLKAIEIYKNKPIFYSIGNFIFQSDTTLFCMPEDFREKYGLPQGLSVKEQIGARARRGNGGLHADVVNFRSLMPFLTYEEGRLRSVTLYPLRLNMHTGLPSLADPAEVQAIYHDLCQRNLPFGTAMKINGSVIEVEVS